ncbi:DUF3224 domain-containing protein [Owenweeksia hongkongensis]|uniref:DUF3224 domain-containing protein n=1 Tax=Owenweeksia hongkongensis TaxID=253245 RepID=UPI003A9562B6
MKATGSFEVKMTPLDFSLQASDGAQLGRMSIDKTFHGDLSAQSKGEMLSAMTSVKGSAGYVAIEQTSGTLYGKKGSFILQHFGTMAGNDDRLILEVVPNSGSGELEKISGSMKIIIKEGKHFYEFEYQL